MGSRRIPIGQTSEVDLFLAGRLDLEDGVAHVPQTPPTILGQTSAEQPADGARGLIRDERPVGFAAQDGGDGVGDCLTGEELPRGEHLVEHAAEGPDVTSLVDGLSASLFGAHIGGGAEDDAFDGRVTGEGGREGERGIAGFTLPRLGEAEVEDLDTAIAADLDVGRFEIPVDDSGAVRRFERKGELARDVVGGIAGQRALRDSIAEIIALDQFHGEKTHSIRLEETVDRGDVGMIQRCQESRLAFEPREPIGVVGHRFRKDLEGNLAVEAGVECAPDDTHPTLAEFVDDGVVQQSLAWMGHRFLQPDIRVRYSR